MNSQHENAKRERWSHLDAGDAGRIAIVAFGIFGLSMAVLVALGFQPGWANGWPISKHTVFASFVTVTLVVGVFSLVTAVLIMLCYGIQQFANRAFVGWSSFLVIFLMTILATVVSVPGVYAIVHAAIVQDWK
jgi:hypothetical protein